jgi:hypothetical protein
MAASARATVGSATWIAQERTQAEDFLEQELEEFRYSAQNELEWLNENMSDIFSKNKLKFADVFKTPSKLRGKTPRTIRKTDQRTVRAPLTDIFAAKSGPSPVKTLNFTGFTTSVSVARVATPEVAPQKESIARDTTPEPFARLSSAQRRVTSEASFVSAKDHNSDKENNVTMEDVHVFQNNDKENNVEMEDIQVYQESDKEDVAETEDIQVHHSNDKEDNVEMEDVQVHQSNDKEETVAREHVQVVQISDKENNAATEDLESDTSSPEQPLHRKSSFTFSSLPAREPLQKFKSTNVVPTLAAREPLRETILAADSPLKKSISTPVLPKPAAPAEAEGSAHKNRLWSAIKSAKKIFASSAGTSAAAKLEAHSNDEELAAPPTVTKPAAPPAGKLKAPGRLARPTKETAQSKPAPAIIRVASQSQRLGQGHSSQPSFSSSTNGRSAPPSRDASSRAPPPMTGRVKALEAAAKKKEADERAAARKAEQKLEIERKRTEAKIQKEVEERKRAEAKAQKEAEERKRIEAKIQKEAEAEERKRADARAQKEAEEARSRAAHDLAETIKRERAVQNQHPPPRSDVPGTLRQLTKTLKPALKRTMPTESGPAAEVKRRRTNEEQDEQMGGMGSSRPSVMAPPKRPSTMRKVCKHHVQDEAPSNTSQENINKFNHGYSHAPPPAAHHASGMYKPSNSTQMQHLQHKPMHPSHLVQMSSARIPFAASESSNQQHYAGSSSQHEQMNAARNPFAASESSSQPQQHYNTGYAQQNQQMYKTPARPAAHMIPKSAPKSANTILGDNIELPDIMTDSEDEDDDEDGKGGGFRVPSWAATPALKVQLEDQQLIDPESVFGPIGEMNMEEMFKNGKNTERLKQFRNRGSSALWVENRDQITSAEKRRDRELRAKMVRDGGWTYDPDAMRRP